MVFKTENPNNPVAVVGPTTVCSTGSYTYTVNNLPRNATCQWNVGSNLIKLSEDNYSVTVRGAIGASGTGTISLTYITIANVSVQKNLNVWVGHPSIPAFIGPQHVDVGCGGSYSATGTNDPSATYQWSVSPSTHEILYSAANATIYFYAQSDYYITVDVTNTCGTSTAYYYIATGELEPFSIYPIPATDLLNVSYNQSVENKVGVENVNLNEKYTIQLWNERVGLVKVIESNVSTSEQISLRGLHRGLYSIHILKDKKVVKKQKIWIK